MNNRISLEMSGVQYASQGEMQECIMKNFQFNKSQNVPSKSIHGEAMEVTLQQAPMTWGDVAKGSALVGATCLMLGGLTALLMKLENAQYSEPKEKEFQIK